MCIRDRNRIMSRFKKGETAVATVSGISFARLLGVTSPKISTTTVSTIVDTVAPRSAPVSYTHLCLKEAKKTSTSDFVVANRDGDPLSYTQFKRLWQYIVCLLYTSRCV